MRISKLIDYTKQGRIVTDDENEQKNTILSRFAKKRSSISRRLSVGTSSSRSGGAASSRSGGASSRSSRRLSGGTSSKNSRRLSGGGLSRRLSGGTASVTSCEEIRRKRGRRQSHSSIASAVALFRGQCKERKASDCSTQIPETLELSASGMNLDLSEVFRASERPPILLAQVPNTVSCTNGGKQDNNMDCCDEQNNNNNISSSSTSQEKEAQEDEVELVEFFLKIPPRKNRRKCKALHNDIRKRFGRGGCGSSSNSSGSSRFSRRSLIQNIIAEKSYVNFPN